MNWIIYHRVNNSFYKVALVFHEYPAVSVLSPL
jgi:hypothetical protein